MPDLQPIDQIRNDSLEVIRFYIQYLMEWWRSEQFSQLSNVQQIQFLLNLEAACNEEYKRTERAELLFVLGIIAESINGILLRGYSAPEQTVSE